ncbi:uncharacterized protein LACBIDRAFT_317037 [Laccaria bicolor S238N-H82]|uniref:Predicted protein n=1 Tax=Laccaria bicolor (strain S238N-H82 / ATCC MYA-4686) TaxID=486041 RepID=B0D490_LACBS|nr:uncharacterized protein LACBIDRAFT_317037 [Laccaria bicolor S238N-H82]EDR10290.1 predicted protein [Laccaria bicolor S238N-H82]|eukprot:XP_001878740.1 predicted protein [Laccaria bicolor S238N-H82]
MSTTTQILFNSPALHSLKREQLVKLCKIHSIKANGKNIELIDKLKRHAQTLPKDSPLSIAARSESTGFVPCPPQDDQTDEEAAPQEGNNAVNQFSMPRPSEQWEVVMESIQELEENSSQGTLSSLRTLGSNNGGAGEFGTGGSKSTTMSSSIKALATSLGLRRTNTSKPDLASTTSSKSSHNSVFPPATQPTSHDELEQNSTPYSDLPPAATPPQTDHFTFNPTRMSMNGLLGEADAPLPGHALRPGVPAPSNARLSLGLGLGAPSTPTRQSQPTTTIRLVSNPLSSHDTSYGAGENSTPQLKPFKTTFDLVLGSPTPSAGGFGSMAVWPPASPGGDNIMRGIYPTLTFADLPPTMPSPSLCQTASASDNMDTEEDYDPPMPGSLTPARATTSSGSGALAPPVEPFIFGSPLPKHRVSNHQFRVAAASVLEEMNKRLQEEGVQGVGLDIINNLHPGAHSQKDLAARDIKALPGNKRGEIKEKFEKMHEEEFRKMEGIDVVVKRKAERSPRKESEPVLGKKRKSSAIARDDAGGRRGPGGPIAGRASGTRVISNGRRAKAIPGAFGDEDGDEEEEEEEENVRAEKRVRVDSGAAGSSKVLSPEELKKEEEEEEERKFKEREREAIRRKLEMNRAKRRSSAVPGGLNGRRSGRVSVGRNVPLAKPKPSRFGFFSSAKSIVQNVWNRGKAPPPTTTASSIPKPVQPATKEKIAAAPSGLVQKASIAPARPTIATAKRTRVPSLRVNKKRILSTRGLYHLLARGRLYRHLVLLLRLEVVL